MLELIHGCLGHRALAARQLGGDGRNHGDGIGIEADTEAEQEEENHFLVHCV